MDHYADRSHFLKDECYINEEKEREYIMQEDDLFESFQEVYYAVRDLTVTRAS